MIIAYIILIISILWTLLCIISISNQIKDSCGHDFTIPLYQLLVGIVASGSSLQYIISN